MRIKDTVPYDLICNNMQSSAFFNPHALNECQWRVGKRRCFILLSLHWCKSQQYCAIGVLTCKCVFMFFVASGTEFHLIVNILNIFQFSSFWWVNHKPLPHRIKFYNVALGWSACDPALGLLWPWIQHRSEEGDADKIATDGIWYDNSWLVLPFSYWRPQTAPKWKEIRSHWVCSWLKFEATWTTKCTFVGKIKERSVDDSLCLVELLHSAIYPGWQVRSTEEKQNRF